MKTCSRCKLQKAENEFNFKIKSKGLRQYHCKECSRKYVQNHYSKNRNYYLKKAQTRNNSIRNSIRQFVWNYLLEHACIDCGESDPIVLEFDHISDKIAAVSEISHTRSIRKVVDEISKCEVRCANCHRRRTARQNGWYKLQIKKPL